ncbi:MAG: amidase domain-containing protein [Bacillota bacterium]
MRRYLWLIMALTFVAALVGGAWSRAAPDPSVERFLEQMYTQRAQALLTGSSHEGLERFYDLSVQGGKFAHVHETGRIQYVQSWAAARKLRIGEARTYVTNLRVKQSGETATISLIARTRLGYTYDGQATKNEMGIGSWHWLQVVRKDGEWKVQKEFYLDALGSEWSEPYVPKAEAKPSAGPAEVDPEEAIPVARGRLDRAGARAYAEKYCGAAWGCGNNSDYNERYQSYRNLGGDCANFASQTLVEGGKLKPDWIWRHDKAGSTCWVNAQSFVRYLTSSGRAALLARGTYPKVVGALSRLEPGDIIGYQLKGTITHVSIVTGKDSAGVPIVAAHTADRFRNPWDLGWDKKTVYWILHLRD